MKRRAFVVGRNGPAAMGLDTLRYAESDALRMSRSLSGPIAAFDQVEGVTNTADARTCLAQFEQLAAECDYDDTLLFYFSGHGHHPRGDLFMLFPDTDARRLVTTALPISAVKSILAQSRARVRILVLDCCHSGAAGHETMRGGSRLHELALVETARDCASVIIAACGRHVTTREDPHFGGGYLTHLLVRALGAESARADIDRDGLVSVVDFIEWASRQTASANAAAGERPRLEAPEIYGDFRSQVYLTASRFVMRDDSLARAVMTQVAMITTIFAERKAPSHARLQVLARPIKAVAPTFTSLGVLDELFAVGGDAAIFAAATMLQIRRDPTYMSRLIGCMNDRRLRDVVTWRVLRAVRDTITRYEFTAPGRSDFIWRLQQVARQRDHERPHFAKGTCLAMIAQIITRMKIPATEVFSSAQRQALGHVSDRRPKSGVTRVRA